MSSDHRLRTGFGQGMSADPNWNDTTLPPSLDEVLIPSQSLHHPPLKVERRPTFPEGEGAHREMHDFAVEEFFSVKWFIGVALAAAVLFTIFGPQLVGK